MYVLAIECSTISGGVALSHDRKIVGKETWDRHSSHGEFVIPAIHKILDKSKAKAEDIGLIAVDIGPGRFTGVRVAINAARSVSYSLNIPIAAFTSLRVLCESCTKEKLPVVTIINAHKNMVYTARFENRNGTWNQTLEPQALTLGQFRELIQTPHLCVGDGYEAYEKFFDPDLMKLLIRKPGLVDHPKVEVLSLLAESGDKSHWTKVEPLYIRLSEAEEKLKSRT